MMSDALQKISFLALLFLMLCFFVSPISVSLTTITYLFALLFVLLSGDWRERWDRLKQNKAAMSFWLIASLFIIGIFYSTNTSHLIFHDLQKRHWLFITPFFIVMLTEERWRKYMINAFLLAMIITLFFALLQGIFHINLTDISRFFKPQNGGGVFADHIVQNVAMNIAAFICGYRFFFEKKYRMIYAILFVLMAISIIFMSTGRTGYGIFFLLLCYLGLIRFGWKGVLSAGVLSVAMITIAFFASPHFQSRMKTAYQQYQHYDQTHHGNSIGIRVEMWHIAGKMIRERLWFGYGTGGIETALPTVVPAKDRVSNPSVDYVESIYLNFLLEFGVFGLVVLLVALALQIKASFELPHNYRCLIQAVLIAILFGGFFNAFFVAFSVSHFYALFSAVCFSARRVASNENQ